MKTISWSVVVVAAVLGCTGTPPGPGGPSRAGAPGGRGPLKSPMIEALRRDAWIGQAHNDAIDAFRVELRRPGHVAPDLCEHIGKRNDHAREAMARSALCAEMVAQVTVRPAASSQASHLLGLIERGIDSARNAEELDVLLGKVVAGAVTLEQGEYVAITAAVSVARGSFAYWRDNLRIFAQEVEAEYGPCLERYRRSGMTAAQIRAICIRGADTAVPPREAATRNVVRQAGFTPARRCAGYDYRAVAKDDARGAFVGALFGNLPGALAGGSAASIASGVEETWGVLTCTTE